jgi:predicted metal-dependent phosphoesterase TrpH
MNTPVRLTGRQAHDAGKLGKADLHLHSTYSDGIATREEILAHTQNYTDLNVIAITDHDEIAGALHARDLKARKNYRFDIIVGEEISTRDGHLLALFIEKRIPPHLCMERSLELIHEQGGLAIIAHPLHKFFSFSCSKAVMDRIHAADDSWFDGIETWNASFCGIYANGIAARANRSIYHLAEVGNSDAHLTAAIGSGFTWFVGQSASHVRQSIVQGVSAPGGKLWNLQAYYHWGRNLIAPKSCTHMQPSPQRLYR